MKADAALADYPKTIVLADGLHVGLRPMTPADGPSLDALVARLSEADRGYLRDEAAGGTGADVSAAGCDAAPELTVLALDGARVAAAATLRRRGAPGEYRLADLRLVIDPDYRRRRLGTWMLLDGVHLAGSLGVERLVAEVPAHDEDFLAALHRLDFAREAVLPHRYRGPDGRVGAGVVMVKALHRGWTDF